MRAIFGTWALLLSASVALAAPGRPSAPTPQLDENARRFGQELYQALDQISDTYIRPIPREKLYVTALTGLYRAARKPVPRALIASVQKVLSETDAPGDLRKPPPEVEPREALLGRAFLETGLCYEEATLAAYRSVAALLDPHSGIVTSEQQRRSVGLDQESLGLGLEMQGATVETVHPGGPAQRAGLLPGDVLLSVDGQPANALPPAVAANLANQRVQEGPRRLGEENTTEEPPLRLVRLRYRRVGKGERDAVVLRERFRSESVLGSRRRNNNSWNYFLDRENGIAHVRIASLSRGTGNDLREALEGLLADGMRGLVLDLRWCPGGYLNEAVDVAGLFLGDESIATVKGRGREDSVYRGAGVPLCKTLPLVVLVNNETSGGAELIAAALQDHKRARIVGQRTLGKASVQTPLSIGLDGVGFKLTTGTFVRPTGKNLHRFPESQSHDDWGVVPDEDCRVSAALGAKLKQDWLLWSLRPPRSLDRLALDDPQSDPQQRAAYRVALRMLDTAPQLTRGK
jgi:C-terminal peptidase prc